MHMATVNATAEVCREFLDKKCKRDERYCKYAHPSPRHEINNGRVVCCLDSLKNRCTREKPPCRYFHPPRHIKDKVIDNMKYQKLCKEFGIEDEEGNADLQDAVMNTLLPQLNLLTDKIIKYGTSEGFEHLDPSVADTLKSCRNLLDVMVNNSSESRNDVIEVCREYLRGDCNRPNMKCKFAHPGSGVFMNSDQTVTVCLNFLRGNCSLENCRYFHVPSHLRRFIGDSQGGRKRKSSGAIDEGPSTKQVFDGIMFGRTPPRYDRGEGLYVGSSRSDIDERGDPEYTI